ncbi:MAG: CBS domain-containing protein, partial [Haloarculaceae archaeon]
MNVADVMTPREEVVTVEVPGTRDDVLEYLQDRSFSSIPVVKQTDDGEIYRGIVSREALIDRPDEDQLALLVDEVPATMANTSLEGVANLMLTEGERRIPIVDGRLEGIVTVTDLIR